MTEEPIRICLGHQVPQCERCVDCVDDELNKQCEHYKSLHIYHWGEPNEMPDLRD